MRISIVHMALAVAVTSALELAPHAAVAQTNVATANPAALGMLSTTREGQPNLQGVWRVQPGIAVYSYDIEAPSPEVAYPGRGASLKATFKPIVVDPPDGRIPYQAWARKERERLYQAAFEPKTLQELDPQALCVPGGPPRTAYQGSFQIFQVPGYVIFANEYAHQYRVIPLDGRPHLTDKIKLFTGDARGRYEGNTLVVEITNFNGRNWLDVAGDFHSDAFKVVERWTRVAAESLQYEATIEDPNVYTRPWKMRIDLVPQTPGYYLLEEPCHEGNQALPELRFPEGQQKRK